MSKTPHTAARRALGLAALSGLGLSAAPAAHAATRSSDITGAGTGATTALASVHDATSRLGTTQLYPLAHTPLDVLSNNMHVPVAGMDLSTFPVTAPFRDGLPLREAPVVGGLLR